jgi:hypothetical protein
VVFSSKYTTSGLHNLDHNSSRSAQQLSCLAYCTWDCVAVFEVFISHNQHAVITAIASMTLIGLQPTRNYLLISWRPHHMSLQWMPLPLSSSRPELRSHLESSRLLQSARHASSMAAKTPGSARSGASASSAWSPTQLTSRCSFRIHTSMCTVDLCVPSSSWHIV